MDLSLRIKNMRQLLSWALVICVFAGASGCSREARKAARLASANRFFQDGNYDRAEIEYLNVLKLDRKNADASRQLGLIYLEQSQLQKAFFFLSLAKTIDPENIDVRTKLAVLYSLPGPKSGSLTNALNEARFVLAKQPTNEEAVLVFASCAANTNNVFKPAETKAMQQTLQELRQQYAEHAVFQILAGNEALAKRDLKSAEAAFRKAVAAAPKSSLAQARLGQVRLMQYDPKQTNFLALANEALKAAADLSPIRSNRRLSYADFKRQTGAIEEAKTILQAITAKAPDYVPAWNAQAEIAFQQQKPDDCSLLLQKALARDPENAEAHILNARVQMVKNELPKAIEELTRLNARYPGRPDLLYQLGVAQLLNKDIDKAVENLTAAVNRQPDFTQATLLLSELSLRKGNYDVAINRLNPLIASQPKLGQAYVLLAEAYHAQRKLDTSLAVYRQLLQQFPNTPEAYYATGNILREQNKPAEARKAFEKTLELATNHVRSVTQLVVLDLAETNFPAALQRVQKLIDKDPKSAGPPYLQAQVYQAKNDLAQAEASLLKAIELEPNFRDAYMRLARLYAVSNRHQQALDRLQGVLTKNPKDSAALMQMGMIYDQKKDYAKAAETYEKALALSPNFQACLNNLAYLYAEHLNKLDRAFELATKARNLDLQQHKAMESRLASVDVGALPPPDPATADTLGWILYRRGDYAQAASLLRESAQNAPAEPEIQFHLGMAEYRQGEEEAARVALQRALQLSKDFQGKDEAQQCLAILNLDTTSGGANVVQTLEQSLAKRPDDPILLSRLAGCYERAGAIDKAVSTYEKGLKLNPGSVPLMLKLAQLQAGPLKRPAAALELARAARKGAPDDPSAGHIFGQLLFQTGDYAQAYSLLLESSRKQPKQPQVLYDYAWAAYGLGRVDEARSAMQAAVQNGLVAPAGDAAKRFLALTASAANASQSAAASVQAAQALATDSAYVPALMVAAEDQQRTNSPAAVQTCRKILGIFPQFIPAAKILVTVCGDLPGDEQKTFDLGMKAREAYPTDAKLAEALGKIAYRLKNDSFARLLLKEAAAKRSNDADLFYHLGLVHYRLKEKADAKSALATALKLGLPPQQSQEAQRILQELK